jgi:hypothetical protein
MPVHSRAAAAHESANKQSRADYSVRFSAKTFLLDYMLTSKNTL